MLCWMNNCHKLSDGRQMMTLHEWEISLEGMMTVHKNFLHIVRYNQSALFQVTLTCDPQYKQLEIWIGPEQM